MRKSNAPRNAHLSPHSIETERHPSLSGILHDCSHADADLQHKTLIHNPTYARSSTSAPRLDRGRDTHDNQQLLERLNSAVNGKLAISVPKMAEILSISSPTADALARRAGFPAFQVGNRTLVSVPGLVAWVQQASAGEVL